MSQEQQQSPTPLSEGPLAVPVSVIEVTTPDGKKGNVLLFQTKVVAQMPGEPELHIPNQTVSAIINVLDACGFIKLVRPHANKPNITLTGG